AGRGARAGRIHGARLCTGQCGQSARQRAARRSQRLAAVDGDHLRPRCVAQRRYLARRGARGRRRADVAHALRRDAARLSDVLATDEGCGRIDGRNGARDRESVRVYSERAAPKPSAIGVVVQFLVPAALLIVAVIHLTPSIGVLGATRLAGLYGVAAGEPNLELLLRHRAVVFGILGLLLLAAVFIVALRPAAILVGFGSVISFLVLARMIRPLNARLARVAIVDVVALVLLAAAAIVEWVTR